MKYEERKAIAKKAYEAGKIAQDVIGQIMLNNLSDEIIEREHEDGSLSDEIYNALMGNEKEEDTMKNPTKHNQFTFEGHVYYTNYKGTYFYCIKPGKTKADRIPKGIYDEAKELYKKEQNAWEAEADAERKAREDKMMADAKATEDAVNGLENLSEDEKTTIEPAEAELLNNVRKEKKAKEGAKKTARKPRRSKDIAYEGHGVTLTAKQVDFIHHLPDTCFWEHGLDSTPWCDVLADEIGGQFAGKPMTTGAMISTICEKGLATRAKDRVNGKKATFMALTELGKEVAKELGLE